MATKPSTDMEYRRVGASGLRVSAYGLGGWLTFGGSLRDESDVARLLRRALDAGINFFDMADVYAKGAAEEVMGRALLSATARHRLVLSSKLYWPMSDDPNDRGLSRKHVMESIERSLRRIGTDYLDIYFCHRHDEDAPLEETARAMDDLIRQGKVLYWGTSEWTGPQIREAAVTCDRLRLHAPRVEQPQYSLLERTRLEKEVLPAAEDHGLGLVAWSPLASGLLTGKHDDAVAAGSRLASVEWLRESVRTQERIERVKRMKPLAAELSCTRAQLALAWVAGRPGISSVILGATSVAQLEENLGAARVKLTPETLAALDGIFPAA